MTSKLGNVKRLEGSQKPKYPGLPHILVNLSIEVSPLNSSFLVNCDSATKYIYHVTFFSRSKILSLQKRKLLPF